MYVLLKRKVRQIALSGSSSWVSKEIGPTQAKLDCLKCQKYTKLFFIKLLRDNSKKVFGVRSYFSGNIYFLLARKTKKQKSGGRKCFRSKCVVNALRGVLNHKV